MALFGSKGIFPAAVISVAYYTDPACPWSWAFEPAVRRLMVDFGAELDWTFVMGGLHRSLDFNVPRGAAARAGLAEEWLRVSAETQAPLDPLLWADGPISSSYPACMAVRAAADQAGDGGYRYLRRLRESIMCERRKLDQPEALIEEGRATGLDIERFRIDLRSNATTESFAADLERTEALGARIQGPLPNASRGAGNAPLPALVFLGNDGQERILAGFHPAEAAQAAALEAGAKAQDVSPLDVEEAIRRFGRVTTREIEVLCGLPGPRASAELFRLAVDWRLRPLRRLTGYLWEAAEGH
jgi:predicted DsbA family dithiol-disulfide isomerase